MAPTPPSDAELVQNALTDLEAFGGIVDRYERPLKMYILRLSNISELEAEEVLQEVFIKAWKNLNGFDQSLKLSSWLYRITHNEVISNHRKLKSRGEDLRVHGEEDEDIFASIAGNSDFVAEFDQKLDAQTVAQVLEQLPEKYREVLVLKFLEDQSYDEIADILQKPPGTVGTMINRAKTAFRDIVERQAIKLS